MKPKALKELRASIRAAIMSAVYYILIDDQDTWEDDTDPENVTVYLGPVVVEEKARAWSAFVARMNGRAVK